MSDRDTLRSILFDPESDDDAGPHDGERAAGVASAAPEAAEDETNDLTPEELVAEAVRQTNDELGIADAEDGEGEATPATAAAAGEDADDLAALREKARQWDEHLAGQAQRDVEAKQQEIVAQAQRNEAEREAKKERYSAFYRNEELRLLAQVDADAANTPDPEAYKRAYRPMAIANCRNDEARELRKIDLEYNSAFEALDQQYRAVEEQARLAQQRPQFADFLMQKLDLPADDLEIRAEILRSGGDFATMAERARQIAWMVNRHRQASQQLDQAEREVKAKEVKLSQPHSASSTNTPRRAKPVQYASSGPERKRQLAAIMALPG